jgi:dihydroxyacetone kinase-like predicted kinase
MHEQVAARAERLSEQLCGVVAVVSGPGMAAKFGSFGAVPLDGGPTLNPSTLDILAAIHSAPAEGVVVLPNSANVRMTAEEAARQSDKEVRVLSSRSQQAGLAAVVPFDANLDVHANAEAMGAALDAVRTGAVTEAARDDGEARFRAGEAIGFVDEELVAWGDAEETLRQVLVSLAADAELVTLIAGPDAPLGEDQIAPLVPDGVEFELSDGGQPSYWWLVAAE